MRPPGELLSTPPTLVEVRRIGNGDRDGAGGRGGLGGRGVFARQDIPFGTLIERAPVLVIPREQVYGAFGGDSVRCPRLTWYVFGWEEITPGDDVALGLGYLSLYNHDWPANARWERVAPDLIEITAHSDIPAGREITINYNGDVNDPEPLDFSTHRSS